jgi:uncharacterized surface protein with fasciclin (FAS1) repeats
MKINQKLQSIFLVTAIGTMITFSSCKKDDDPAPVVVTPPLVLPTIAGYVTADTSFSILLAAVSKAGLAGTLSAPGTYTVFAPTNAAFRAANITLASIAATTAQADIDALGAILKYHVLATKVSSGDVPVSDAVTTLNTRSLYASKNANGVFVNGVKVIAADVAVSNGVIHAIGKVLIPPTNTIAATVIAAATSTTAPQEFNLLLAAVSRAGLAGVLSGPGKYTVFAPTNAAFIAAGAPFNSAATIATADSATVRRIVLGHVIGTNVFASDLTQGGEAPTLNTLPAPGQFLTISLSPTLGVNIKGAAPANLAPIVAASANLVQTNGVIHVVSKVILP